MEELSINLSTPVAIALAMSQGWLPMIEDQSQEMVGDEYPKIPNPVTYQQFIEQIAPAYLENIVKTGGRSTVIDNLTSIYETVVSSVRNGNYDEKILAGDFDGIMQDVKDNL